MKFITMVTLLMVGMLAMGQVQHAPNREQCNADKRLWIVSTATLESLTKDSTVSQRELMLRAEELRVCAVAYDTGDNDFYVGSLTLLRAHWTRVNDFFLRHPEIADKFDAEDKAGLR